MVVSIVVHEKLPGQKGVMKKMENKKQNMIFWHFQHLFTIILPWLI